VPIGEYDVADAAFASIRPSVLTAQTQTKLEGFTERSKTGPGAITGCPG